MFGILLRMNKSSCSLAHQHLPYIERWARGGQQERGKHVSSCTRYDSIDSIEGPSDSIRRIVKWWQEGSNPIQEFAFDCSFVFGTSHYECLNTFGCLRVRFNWSAASMGTEFWQEWYAHPLQDLVNTRIESAWRTRLHTPSILHVHEKCWSRTSNCIASAPAAEPVPSSSVSPFQLSAACHSWSRLDSTRLNHSCVSPLLKI
jgi:hypothetical protein